MIVIRDITHSPRMASTSVVPLPDEAYFRIPSSSLVKLIYEALTAGRNYNRLAAGKAAANHKVFLDVKEEDGRTVFEYHNSRGTLFFSLPADVLKSGRALITARRLLVIMLAEWNRQQEADVVTIPLQHFYRKYKAYYWNNTAHRGLKKAIPLLAFISAWGEQRIKNKNKTEYIQLAEETQLFDSLSLSNGELKFSVNQAFREKQKILFEYFSCLPAFFFQLPPAAQDMLFHVFFTARQNLASLKKDNLFFAVSFKALHAALCLPGIDETRYQRQLAIQPLIDAVEAINKKAAGTGLALTIRGNLNATARECLSACKIEVRVAGDMLESYQPMIERRQRKQQEAAKRARRVQKLIDEKAAKAAAL